jgi:hypothetical protein
VVTVEIFVKFVWRSGERVKGEGVKGESTERVVGVLIGIDGS